MPLLYVGRGSAVASKTINATLTMGFPTGYSAVAGDLAIVQLAGWGSNNGPLFSIPTGYTGTSQSERNIGTSQNLCTRLAYKVLDGTESAPSITVQADYSDTNYTTNSCAGVCTIWRGVNIYNPIGGTDIAASTAAQDFQPDAPTGTNVKTSTTTSNYQGIISFVATGDNNGKSFASAQSFTEIADVSSTINSNLYLSIGSAYRFIPRKGTSYTMCTWRQSDDGFVAGYDSWATVSIAINGADSGWGVNAMVV